MATRAERQKALEGEEVRLTREEMAIIIQALDYTNRRSGFSPTQAPWVNSIVRKISDAREILDLIGD